MREKFIFPLLCFIVLAGCDNYPKDPNNSLQQAKQSALRVGAVSSPPWVLVDDGRVTGLEADIIERFAQSIDTEIDWMTGSESEILPVLEQRELHIVIGGLTKSTPWKKHVGLTNPYKKEKVIVCRTNAGIVPEEIEHLSVGVETGSAIIADVKKKGGKPVVVELLTGYEGLVAVYEYQADEAGCGPERSRLVTHRHVFAVPKGENALLVALERYLNATGY